MTLAWPRYLEEFHRELLRMNVTVSPAPAELSGTQLQAEAWVDDRRDQQQKRAQLDLPPEVMTIYCDGTPIICGPLTTTATAELRDTLRRFRNQALVARSWLGDDAPNLQCFLVAPEGSAAEGEWRQRAAEIEADDRVCRKLVWLRPANGSTSNVSEFISRTFLASPWIEDEVPAQSRLDQMSVLPVPVKWLEAINEPGLDADALVERLLSAKEL